MKIQRSLCLLSSLSLSACGMLGLPPHVPLSDSYRARLAPTTVMLVLPQKQMEEQFIGKIPGGDNVPMTPDNLTPVPVQPTAYKNFEIQESQQAERIGNYQPGVLTAGVGIWLGNGIAGSVMNEGNREIAERAQQNIAGLFRFGDLGEPQAAAVGLDAGLKGVDGLGPKPTQIRDTYPSDQELEDAVQGGSVLVISMRYSFTPDLRSLELDCYTIMYNKALGPQNYKETLKSPPNVSVSWKDAPLYRNTIVYMSAPVKVQPKTDADRAFIIGVAKQRYDLSKARTQKEYADFSQEQFHAKYDADKSDWTDRDLDVVLEPKWEAGDGALLKDTLRDATAEVVDHIVADVKGADPKSSPGGTKN